MSLQCKSDGLNGKGRIGRVTFSKTGEAGTVRPWLVLLVVLFCCLGCSKGPSNASERAALEAVLEGLAGAKSITLYEGLPHPMFEPELLESELATKETLKTLGFPFYKRPLPISAQDAVALRALCSDLATYETYRDGKACGGFHPDYRLDWSDGMQTHSLLICLGCGEAKVDSSGVQQHFDLEDGAHDRLKALLQGFRDQRPRADDR